MQNKDILQYQQHGYCQKNKEMYLSVKSLNHISLKEMDNLNSPEGNALYSDCNDKINEAKSIPQFYWKHQQG